MHGHTGSGITGSDAHVGHASNAGLYQENVAQAPHHLAGSFPGAQISPMASPYGAYGTAQHPMYGASYSGHAYAPYPNYIGHISHYGHPPHYPGASSSPAYHAPMMGGMMAHGAYGSHAAGHLTSHHPQTGMPIAMSNSAASAGAPSTAMASGAMVTATPYQSAPQYNTSMPVAGRHRVTTTLWEDEGTLCFQVDVKGVCVARRHDNNMINGTKLLNVCGMSRGKRDGILKNEKERIVVKVGAMHLKGVWIAFNRAKQLAEQHGIADALYPLFEPNIQSFLYHPDNYPRTAAVMAAAQERHRHYALPNTATTPVKDVSGADMNSNMPLQSNMSSSQWGSPHQSSHDGSNTNNGADAALHYQYQHHPHYQTPGPAMPVQNTNSATPNAMFNSPSAHYQTQSVQAPVRSIPAANLGMERRFDQPAEAHVSSQSLAQQAQISSQQSSQMPHSTQDPIASAEGVTSPTGTTTTASPSTKHHQTEQTDSGSELVHKEEAGSSTIQSASERAGETQEEGDVQTETYAATSLPTESYSSSEKPKDEDETSSAKQSELYADGQAKLGSDSEEKTASSS